MILLWHIEQENTMKRGASSETEVDSYIRSFPPDVQKILQKIRKTIRKAAPGAQETISYGIPTCKLHGNLVHFAGYKRHIGFYPTPSGITAFKTELAPYECSKGTVRFPAEGTIPYDLIEKIVKYRVRENLEKQG